MAKKLKDAGKEAMAVQINVADWDSQVAAFEKAIKEYGRIDYVFPIAGIGERKAIKNDPTAIGFEKPDLAVVDVDLTGVLYTAFMAIQQMRRQEKDDQGSRGKSMGCRVCLCSGRSDTNYVVSGSRCYGFRLWFLLFTK